MPVPDQSEVGAQPVKVPPVKPGVAAPPPPGSDYTYTEEDGSNKTELLETCRMVSRQRKHGWDPLPPVAFFLPSGGLVVPIPTVGQVNLVPSQVANGVTWRTDQVASVNATCYQMGMNALDVMSRKVGEKVEGDVDDKRTGTEVQQGTKTTTKTCSRTGLPMSRGQSDWPCPNKKCINAERLVFAKRQVCPLCKASKPTTWDERSLHDSVPRS